MTCLLIHDLVEGDEVAIPMPRFGQDQGMDNPYRSILSSDQITAALIERHERFLLNLERAD